MVLFQGKKESSARIRTDFDHALQRLVEQTKPVVR